MQNTVPNSNPIFAITKTIKAKNATSKSTPTIVVLLKYKMNLKTWLGSKKYKQHVEIIHKYENADHGFFCDQRDSYNKDSSDLAYKRTLEFLEKYI